MDRVTRPRRTRRRRTAGVLGVGIASLILAAQPALATTGGTGTGAGSGTETALTTGGDFGGGATPFCLEVTASRYDVAVTGTFTATNGASTATYSGAATVTIETDATYYIAPEGTYGGLAGGACDVSKFGPAGPIPVKITVSSAAGPLGGGIACSAHSTTAAGSGYFRVNSDFTAVAQGSCTVTTPVSGATASSGGNTQHAFHGQLAPCLNPPVPCEASTLAGTWTFGDATP